MIRSVAGIGDSCLWNLIIPFGYSKSCDQFQFTRKLKFQRRMNYAKNNKFIGLDYVWGPKKE